MKINQCFERVHLDKHMHCDDCHERFLSEEPHYFAHPESTDVRRWVGIRLLCQTCTVAATIGEDEE